MNIAGMLLAFMVMTGIALLFLYYIQYNMGEGMVASAITIIFLLYIAGKAGLALFGLALVILLSIAGYVGFVIRYNNDAEFMLTDVFSVYYVYLIVLFLLLILLFFGDHIQHIDELHQWAAAVKYMLAHNRLPIAEDFTDPGQRRACTVFVWFFQRLSGYNEGMMYAAAVLLVWIGMLLPFSNSSLSEIRKVGIYIILAILMVISCYQYDFKNLLVDLPTAAWSAGFAGWWMSRDRAKPVRNLALLAGGAIVISLMKNMIGLMMAVCLLLFILLYHMIMERGLFLKKHFAYAFCGIVFLIILGAFFVTHRLMMISVHNPGSLPVSLQQIIAVTGFSFMKIQNTFTSYVLFLWGGDLGGGQSDLKLSFVMILCLFAAMVYSYGVIFRKKVESIYIIAYGLLISSIYLIALFCAFVFLFSEMESVQLISIQRYLGILALFLLSIPVFLYGQQTGGVLRIVPEFALLTLLVILCTGINENMISFNTAIDKRNVYGYDEMVQTRKEIEQIEEVMKDPDRVYIINQDGFPGGGEYALSSAAYYFERKCSSYLVEPWKFFPEGCYIHNSVPEGMLIQNLPSILQYGKYTYLWIYGTDDYLANTLPYILPGAEPSLIDGQLYKILYSKDGAVEGVKLEKLLYKSDPRRVL